LNTEVAEPDVVLMDIEMPNVNGIEGVAIIKQNFKNVKVIMQTVFEDEEKIFAALQNGADGYILKTAGIERMLENIKEVYNGGAYMTPSVAFQVLNFFKKKQPTTEHNLSPKEIEVLKQLVEGMSYKMVADKLGISYFTVNSHVKKIYEKLHVHSLGEAISIALKRNIV
jgi:DNA-binding NarL/FixJ family response regulator